MWWPIYYTSLGGKMKRFFSLVLIFITAMVLGACSKKAQLTIQDADKTLALHIGDTVNVTPVLTEGFKLTWTSSNQSVVTVVPATNTLSAVISAVGEGSATITVAVDGKDVTATISVTVVKPDPTLVSITGAGTVAIGGTLQLTGAVLPSTANQTLVWSSSSVATATVSSSGVVTGVAEGDVTIRATSVLTSIYKEVTVTVEKPDPTGITITGTNQIVLGLTSTLTATVAPALASQGVVWSSSNTSVATVSTGGVVTAIALGTVTITAKSSAKPTILATKEITIISPDPLSVTVSGPSTVSAGNTATYEASIAPLNAVQTVRWSVSDPTKATINADSGVLTATAVGTLKVIATSTALASIVGELIITISLPDINVELELNGGYWPITKTDAFATGTPLKTITIPGRYNSTAADYYVSSTAGAYLTSFFLNDEDYEMAPSVWQNRAFLNRNDNGFFEVEKVLTAGSANVNPTLADYEYIIFAHEGFPAAYDFIGGLAEGDIITLSGANIETQVGFDMGPIIINVYNKAQTPTTASLIGIGGAEVTLPIPAKFEFVFSGWFAKDDFSGEAVTAYAANGKLYAKWVAAEIPLTGLTLAGSDKATMGITNEYTTTPTPSHATNPNVVWTTSDGDVATITADGVLTPVKEGTVTVTATSVANGEVVATKVVVIYGAPTGISYVGGSKLVVGGVSNSYGKIATGGTTVDQSAITYSSSKPEVFTVDSNGKITAVGAGSADYVMTSTINSEVTKKQTITVYSAEDAVAQFPLTSVVVGKLETKEAIYYNYLNFTEGINAFKTIEEAMVKVADGAKVYVIPGTYAEVATITKNNLTFTGGGTISGKLSVAADVKGLTIDSLLFTGGGCVDLNVKGGIENFTFKNNKVFKSTNELTIINFKNDGTKLNKNIVIANNLFEIGGGAGAARYVRGGNVENLTITGNLFEGIKGKYVDAIRIEGTNETATAGSGVSGVLTINDNVFDKIGQRAIWIRRYSATKVNILANSFYSCGDQTYGGGAQLETWVSGQTTVIDFKYNRLENMTGSFGLRVGNSGFLATATWSVNANYNKFIDFILPATGVSDDIIQAYATAAKDLINADYNLFMRAGYAYDPDDTVMPFVGTYANRFSYEEDVDLAAIIDQADPVHGVAVAAEDMETQATIAYATTLINVAGLDWNVKEAYSSNPGDANDLTNQISGGSRVIRFRGANVAYMELADYIDGLTTLVFDARYYSNHDTAVMKVSKMKEGESTWSEVAVITLTNSYVTQVVAINETGKVKVRIDVTTKSANIDNIKLYQTTDLFSEKYYPLVAPDATGLYVYSGLGSLSVGDRVIYNGESYYFGTSAFASITDLNGKLIANETVYFGPGEYSGDLLIDKTGVSLVGPNGEVKATATKRHAEAILKGKITIAKELQNIEINGFKFTDNAQIINTAGTAGTAAAPTINLKNFTFANNIVESNLASGTGFILFTESANSYSHNIEIIDNTFKTTNPDTALTYVIHINNHAGLVISGNVFKDIKNGVFKVTDASKGLAGNALIANNTFTNIGGRAIEITWLSPLPNTTMTFEIIENTFTNIGSDAIYIGKMNNADVISKMDILENVFDQVNKGILIERVTKTSNTKINLNTFVSVPSEYYVKDNLTADASVIVKLDAKDNIYKDAGEYIVPNAAKFIGEPDFSTKFVTVVLTFVVNEGSPIAAKNVLQGFAATKPADPTRVGYTFAGWFSDEDLTKAFDFATTIDVATSLYAKWTVVEYTVTYNFDGGYWKYPSRDAMLVDFLTDLYAYINPTESLSDFMHGAGKSSGFDGLWHSNETYKLKIYAGPRPTAVDNNYFASSEAYMAKWLPFFDMLEDFIYSVNDTQHFWGTSTQVGLIRIGQYVKNVKPATYVTDTQMAMMPKYGSAEKFTILTDTITLKAPIKQDYVFMGWYLSADFTGAEVTQIVKGSTGNLALFAKWAPMSDVVVSEKQLYVDPTLDKADGSVFMVGEVYYRVGVNAFNDINLALAKLAEGVTLVVKAGVYDVPITIAYNNVSIIGPNAGVAAGKNLENRAPEAEFKKLITLSGVENILIDGVKLNGDAQIYSNQSNKGVTLQNIYFYQVKGAGGAQGVIYTAAANATIENKDFVVKNSAFVDADNYELGYRAVRVENATNLLITNNYFFGFFDVIRLEGASGVKGSLIIDHNVFENIRQYGILVSKYSEANIEVTDNLIGVIPGHDGVYGYIAINGFTAVADKKSTVNVLRNTFPDRVDDWHNVRFNSNGATAAQLEINVNYNVFCEGPGDWGSTAPFYYLIADHTTTATDFKVNGINNYFLFTEELLASSFLNTIYVPNYRDFDDIVAEVPEVILEDYKLPTLNGLLTWKLKTGEDSTIYDVATGKLLKLVGPRTTVVVEGLLLDTTHELTLTFGIIDPLMTQFYYNSNDSFVAATGGTWETQTARAGFGGYMIIVGDKQYFLGEKAYIPLVGTEENQVFDRNMLRPLGLGSPTDIYNNALVNKGVVSTSLRGYGVLYVNTGKYNIVFDPSNAYGRNNAAFASYAKMVFEPQEDGTYKVLQHIGDTGTNTTTTTTAETMLVLKPGEMFWCPHTWETSGTYLAQPGYATGVLVAGTIIEVIPFKAKFN